MPDNAEPETGQSSQPSQSHAGHIPITEEMDSAKWTMPPMMTVLAVAGVLAIVVAAGLFFAWSHARSHPAAAIAITKMATADMQGNVMVAIQVKIDNQAENTLQIKNIEAEMEAADGRKYTDHAASSGEAARYLQAFPSLAEAKAEPLREEMKIPPKASYTGVAVFAYPVDRTVFYRRKSVILRVQLYDESTLVATQ